MIFTYKYQNKRGGIKLPLSIALNKLPHRDLEYKKLMEANGHGKKLTR